MKNLKKLSRTELKNVFGGDLTTGLEPTDTGGGGNFNCYCGCNPTQSVGTVNSGDECNCLCKKVCDRDSRCPE